MILSNQQYCFLLCLLLLQVAAVRAQENIPAAQTGEGEKGRLHILIDEGRIEADLGEVDRSVVSSTYSVIEAERFRGSFVSLDDLLEQEVGVQARSTGGEGSFSTVLLRGASAEQVMIYLDGVPLNPAAGGAVDLSLIPLDAVERIEVYRGSTPLELGSPSIGGAINIITRRRSSQGDGKNSSASVSLGSFSTMKLAASHRYDDADNDLLLGASYLDSRNNFDYVNDNGTPDNPADDRREQRNNDAVKHLGLLANWKRRLRYNSEARLRVDFNDRYKEIPGVTNSPDMQTYVDTRRINLLAQFDRRGLWQGGVGGAGKGPAVNAGLKLFAGRIDEVFDDSLAQLGFINQRSESLTRRLGGQLYAESLSAASVWKLLAAYSQETYRNESTAASISGNDNRRNNSELSVQNSRYYDGGRLILDLALRARHSQDAVADGVDTGGRPVKGFDKTYRFINPQLGLKYRFNRKTDIRANFGRYSRLPSFLELFGGQGLLLGNPELEKETSLNSDVGVNYHWFNPRHWWHQAQLFAGLFHNRVENLIVQIYNGQGVARSVNIADAVIQGMETSLQLQPVKNHDVKLVYSYTDSINISDINSFNGSALPNYYRHNLGLRYAWHYQHWLFRLEAEWKRDMYYDRSNLLRGDDVNLVNTGVRYRVRTTTIELMLNNLFDENIRYYRNRPTPGFNVALTWRQLF